MKSRHRLAVIAATATLLGTAPLGTLYERWTWLFQGMVVVVAVAAAAAAARALRAPVWAHPPAMLVGLTIALTWLFPSGEELVAILPSLTTLEHFAALVGDAPAAMRDYATPAPDNDALLFVTALGVGLVALLVDLCAVTLRRPALAGLPMLAIYSVPVAIRTSGVPAVPFVIGAIGYLWLLGADNLDRVRRFGRRFSGDGRDIDAWEPSPLAAAGRRLTLVGVVLAVMLPLTVPGMSGILDNIRSGIGGGFGSGGGSGQVNLFAELSGRLNQDGTQEMVRVTTTDPDPFYLRFAVAADVTDTGFAPSAPDGSPVTGGLPGATVRPDANLPQDRYTATVQITDEYNMPMAPTYPELASVAGLGPQWLYDPQQQVVFSHRARAAGLEYDFEFVRTEFTPEVLREVAPLLEDHPMRQYTAVPEVSEVSQLVARLTERADTQYDQVMALYNHFSVRNGFRYDVETGDQTSAAAIVDFLDNKRGFCVQYAAALAWMVRTAGIPARVAIGFTRGTNIHEGAYTLTNRNLHAWTEVYFQGFGWLAFDATPTASVAGAADTEWAPHPDSPDPTTPNRPDPEASGAAPRDPTDNPATDNPQFGEDDPLAGGGAAPSGPRWPWYTAGAVVLLLGLLAIPGASRARIRRNRLAGRHGGAAHRDAHAAWDELLDTMVDFQYPLDLTETPRATVQRLLAKARLPEPAAEGARLLGLAEERARYAREPLAAAGLGAAVRAIRRALATGSTRSTRIRAVLLPPSVTARWQAAITETNTRMASAVSRSSDLLVRLSPRRLLRRMRAST